MRGEEGEGVRRVRGEEGEGVRRVRRVRRVKG